MTDDSAVGVQPALTREEIFERLRLMRGNVGAILSKDELEVVMDEIAALWTLVAGLAEAVPEPPALIWNRPLTDQERAVVREWYSSRYGIPL